MTAGGGLEREVLLPGGWVTALLPPASQHLCLPSTHQEGGHGGTEAKPCCSADAATIHPPGPGASEQVLWGLLRAIPGQDGFHLTLTGGLRQLRGLLKSPE